MNDIGLPLVSVITPSFNQAAFIRETIESVRTQNYPNIEHIVVDGGSTDGTREILACYSTLLGDRFRYVSEADRGQSHAINKGLLMASGDIIGWLNSDDTYRPGAVRHGVTALLHHPDWAMVYGKGYYMDEKSAITSIYNVEPYELDKLIEDCIICQPASFLRKSTFDAIGGIDESFHFCMDYDLWLRIAKHFPIGYIDEFLANSRLHAHCKTVTQYVEVGLPEVLRASLKNFGTVSNNYIAQYIGNYYPKGVFSMLQLFKTISFFGHTPKITSMNRYPDLWIPPEFRIVIGVDPAFPLHYLLLAGHVLGETTKCSIFINGKWSGNYSMGRGAFLLEIPIETVAPACVVEIRIDRHFILANMGISGDTRAVSGIVRQAVALSRTEFELYRMFHKGPAEVTGWVQQHKPAAPRAKPVRRDKEEMMTV